MTTFKLYRTRSSEITLINIEKSTKKVVESKHVQGYKYKIQLKTFRIKKKLYYLINLYSIQGN